jgi:hypothetical protein
MPTTPDAAALAALLPGTWRIGATNVTMWLSGERLRPTFRYEPKSSDPLAFDDIVSYTTATGVEKTILGVDRLRQDGFVWRGRGRLALFTTRWVVAGATGDANIVVLRFSQSRRAPAGVDVIVRDGTDSHEFRTIVAREAEALGLTHGEFASLTWLELAD